MVGRRPRKWFLGLVKRLRNGYRWFMQT
ncbi:hypothetical protein CT19431_40403 [Cupriavidus taiwanensis]|nr:hypothetical protein CT19431_40403 [Cupriavidus taiwanensis]